ncbi:MAG: hypothetical protein ACK5MA_05315 [Parachlamydiaceae bacterium]
MSLEGLRKFNMGYGFPLHKEGRYPGSKTVNVIYKIIVAVPFTGLFLPRFGIPLREHPAIFSRTILASSIVGLPIVCVLDIIATLFTQPIGKALEKRRARQLELAEM